MWGLDSSVSRATFMKNGVQGFKPLPMPFPYISDCIVPGTCVFSYLSKPLKSISIDQALELFDQ